MPTVTYAAKATITCTLTSLANGSMRQSTAIDNTANKYPEVILRIKSNGQTSGSSYLEVWGYSATSDTGYTDGASGSDSAFSGTLGNCVLLGAIKMNVATQVIWGPRALAHKWGGVMPSKWGLIFKNSSGADLSATAGDHVIEYEGVS